MSMAGQIISRTAHGKIMEMICSGYLEVYGIVPPANLSTDLT